MQKSEEFDTRFNAAKEGRGGAYSVAADGHKGAIM